MDINYLLAREQISLAKARSATGMEARRAHAGLAVGYGLRLAATAYPHRTGGAGVASVQERTDG